MRYLVVRHWRVSEDWLVEANNIEDALSLANDGEGDLLDTSFDELLEEYVYNGEDALRGVYTLVTE